MNELDHPTSTQALLADARGALSLPVCNTPSSVLDAEGRVMPRSAHEMPTYKLVEVYDSVKGEGTQAGMPMTFVRFARCNLACEWCDTPYNRIAIELTADELVANIIARSPAWVVFTGGEPTLQLNDRLLEPLGAAGIRMAIETNGMIAADAVAYDLLDYVNISPKLGHPIHPYWVCRPGGPVDEIRFTICDGQTDLWNVSTGMPANAELAGNAYELIGCATKAITISPAMHDRVSHPENWVSGMGHYAATGELDIPSFNTCLRLVKKYRHYGARLSTQVHKFIGVR